MHLSVDSQHCLINVGMQAGVCVCVCVCFTHDSLWNTIHYLFPLTKKCAVNHVLLAPCFASRPILISFVLLLLFLSLSLALFLPLAGCFCFDICVSPASSLCVASRAFHGRRSCPTPPARNQNNPKRRSPRNNCHFNRTTSCSKRILQLPTISYYNIHF